VEENDKRYLISQLDELAAQPCPCGTTRRGFLSAENDVASVHCVNICSDSRTHYHKEMTEIYIVLEGSGTIELDGDTIPLRPMTSIMIKPRCRHRAVPGSAPLNILNIAIPKFDPADEWFD
jgi:mannose-6-phosphate isomerase-like protein (cupin superfamily)